MKANSGVSRVEAEESKSCYNFVKAVPVFMEDTQNFVSKKGVVCESNESEPLNKCSFINIESNEIENSGLSILLKQRKAKV